jgi:hypothetical protein
MVKEFQIDKWKRIYAHVAIKTLDELHALPEAQEFDSGVYFLWRGSDLLYIGKSRGLQGRQCYQDTVNKNFAFHQSSTAKLIPYDRMTCLVLFNGPVKPWTLDGELEAHERAYIAEYRPGFNMDMQAGFS